MAICKEGASFLQKKNLNLVECCLGHAHLKCSELSGCLKSIIQTDIASLTFCFYPGILYLACRMFSLGFFLCQIVTTFFFLT